MIKAREYIRYWSFGGILCSSIAGILFLRYPHLFPINSTLENTMLIGGALGVVTQRFVNSLIIKPFGYYLSLVQLICLRRIIGERTQKSIIQRLTKIYFLDEHSENKRMKE
jgi:hypothetical protein